MTVLSYKKQECPDVPAHVCDYACAWIQAPISSHMSARIVELTPKISELWLQRNPKNRNQLNVDLFSEDMKSNRWMENGESLVFDSQGWLLDGQHRLAAVIATGHSYRAAVILGVDGDARPTVDTGRKRTASDNLQMAGEGYAGTLAATLMLWRGYIRRSVPEMVRPYSGKRHSVLAIFQLLAEYPHIRQAVRMSRTHLPRGARGKIPLSEIAMIFFAITESGATSERGLEFLAAVIEGHNLSTGNPILALRKRLDEQRPGYRMEKRERLGLLLKCWQLWSTGQTRRLLRLNEAEPFPFLKMRTWAD